MCEFEAPVPVDEGVPATEIQDFAVIVQIGGGRKIVRLELKLGRAGIVSSRTAPGIKGSG